MRNDKWILNDQPVENSDVADFGFAQYSNALNKIILRASPPITIGIYGGWGSGKTSLMKILYNKLDGSKNRERVFPIWFNAWRYENERSLVVPLLYTIRDQINLRIKTSDYNSLCKLSKFLDHFIRALSAGMSVELSTDPIKFKYQPKDSFDTAEKIAKELDLESKETSIQYDLFCYLEQVIKDISPLKLVVFIDDLDRCIPEKLIQMLEAIKLFLNFPGIVYIIGIDRHAIENAVVKKFGEGSGIDGNAFIRKLVQVPFTLPILREEDIADYIEKQLRNIYNESSNVSEIANIVATGAGSNPREIKRLLNNLLLMQQLGSEWENPKRNTTFLILQQRWPTTFDSISKKKELFLEFSSWLQRNYSLAFSDLIDKKEENSYINDFSLVEETWDFLAGAHDCLDFSSVDDLDEYLHLSSITSYRSLQPKEIEFQHTVEEIIQSEEDSHLRYRWKLEPVMSQRTLGKIDKIVYLLPATRYSYSERATNAKNHFSISDIGWSNIKIQITVHLKNGEKVGFLYQMDLSAEKKA
jgi:hypothetical protein